MILPKRLRSAFALSATAIMIALAGCSQAPAGSTGSDSSSASAAQATGVAASSEYQELIKKTGLQVSYNADGSRTVTDSSETQVELPAQVERVADLWDANNQMMLLLGAPDKIVATTKQISQMPWYKKVYPKIGEVKVPASGNDLNMESVLETKPDVFIARDKAQADKARSSGIPTFYMDYQDYPGLEKVLLMTAEVVGTDDARNRAVKYVNYLEGNLKRVKDKTDSIPEDQRPKVLHIAGGADVTKVDGSDSIIGEWLKAAGARNSIDGVSNYKNIGVEQIAASAPEQIIVGNNDARKGIDTIKSDKAWADVPAVKNEKLYRNPVGTFNWDRYSTESALQLLWAAQHFHPEKFKDIDLFKETQEFYKTYYGYELSTDDAKRILAGDPPAN